MLLPRKYRLKIVFIFIIGVFFYWLIARDLPDRSIRYSMYKITEKNFPEVKIPGVRIFRNPAIPWCVHAVLNDTFGLRHYLVVRSILHHVQPLVFYLYVSNLNESIPQEFREKMNNEYSNIEIIEHRMANSKSKKTRGTVAFDNILLLFQSKMGGIYVSLDILLQSPLRDMLSENSCLVDTDLHIVVMHPGCPYFTHSDKLKSFKKRLVAIDPNDRTKAAILFNKTIFDRLKPFDSENALTNSDKDWNSLAWRAYCDCDQLEPVRHEQPVMPNIVHYHWFTSNTTWSMTFLQSISILSNLKINNVSHVFIHGNIEPTGPHWKWLQNRYKDKLVHRYYPYLKSFHGKEINPMWPSHIADFASLKILQQYGGIYFDWDSIALKSHDEFRYYDGVMGYDRPYSFGLAHAHMMFNINSEFLQLYINCYANYDPSKWGQTAILDPKEAYLKHPYSLKVPDRFMKCQLNEELIETFNSSGSFNMSDYFAFHYGTPEPEDFYKFELNFASVSRMQNLFGTILRYVINYSDEQKRL